MNYARFGSVGRIRPLAPVPNRVNADIRQYGLFHYAFLERSLHDAFTRLPEISFHPLRIGFNGEGMSLFVTTPLFLYLLWPKERPRLHRALWLTVALVAIPGFFYQNSGYFQFGFRFSLDYTPLSHRPARARRPPLHRPVLARCPRRHRRELRGRRRVQPVLLSRRERERRRGRRAPSQSPPHAAAGTAASATSN